MRRTKQDLRRNVCEVPLTDEPNRGQRHNYQ